jgi:hypothetical protein
MVVVNDLDGVLVVRAEGIDFVSGIRDVRSEVSGETWMECPTPS